MHLKELRAKLRMSQWDLRNKTGIHQTKISLFEQGHICPSEKEKGKIAKALKVKVHEIEWHSQRRER